MKNILILFLLFVIGCNTTPTIENSGKIYDGNKVFAGNCIAVSQTLIVTALHVPNGEKLPLYVNNTKVDKFLLADPQNDIGIMYVPNHTVKISELSDKYDNNIGDLGTSFYYMPDRNNELHLPFSAKGTLMANEVDGFMIWGGNIFAGASGGPVYNKHGKLLGLVSSYAMFRGIPNFNIINLIPSYKIQRDIWILENSTEFKKYLK